MSEPIAQTLPPGPAEAYDLDANDESLPVLRELVQHYGDICRLRPVRRTADSLVIHDPEDIRRVLVANRQNYAKGVGLERIRVLLGNGLIVSEGNFWQRQRGMVQPAFHSRVIRQFSELIRRQNLSWVEHWERCAAKGVPINLTREMSEITLGIVLRALFSTDLERLIESSGGANPFDMLTQDSQRDLQFATRFRGLTRTVRQMIAARQQEARVEVDFLSMLMAARHRESGEPMTERALVDEIMSLIVAGHETSASVLNWTWYLISQHPQVEQRLHEAIESAPASEALTVEQAAQVPYVGQVLSEAMRLYPPVWLFSRRALAEDRLGGYAVPAGTDIFICPYLLHRHPRHWTEPEAFRPERFEEAAEKERHRFTYLPFSAGPRHCVGEGLAMAEMAMHLILCARRFRLKYCGSAPPELEFQINLRTRKDLPMQVLAR